MSFNITNYSDQIKINTEDFYSLAGLGEVSYPQEGSDFCFAVEDSSFWFNHRKNCILELVQSFPPEKDSHIFDVGGGNGYMTLALQNLGYEVALVEPSLQGILNAKQHKGVKLCLHSSFEEAHFFDSSMGVVTAFDVIEHIENDMAFMEGIHKALKPKGKFYLTVPAYNWLWSSADDLAGHYRRYTCDSICKKLEKIGFTVNYATYIFQFLLPAIFLLKALPYRLFNKKEKFTLQQSKKNHEVKSQFMNKGLQFILERELNCVKKLKKISMGSSCLICCTK